MFRIDSCCYCLSCGFNPRLVHIVSMLCPWARHFPLPGFTSLKCKRDGNVSDRLRAPLISAVDFSVCRNIYLYGYIPANTTLFITFVQRRPNVFDVDPTLHKCYKHVLRLLGIILPPEIITSDCDHRRLLRQIHGSVPGRGHLLRVW